MTEGSGSDGAFFPNSKLGAAAFADGMSNMLCASEAKSYTPYVRNVPDDPGASPPSSTAFVGSLTGDGCCIGTSLQLNTGHTEWPDGRVHHSGFTTVLTPNTKVLVTYNGLEFDADMNSRQEGSSATLPTCAAITARSYHTGLVNVGLMDGSVRSVTDGVSLTVWRALGTRSGGEVVGDY